MHPSTPVSCVSALVRTSTDSAHDPGLAYRDHTAPGGNFRVHMPLCMATWPAAPRAAHTSSLSLYSVRVSSLFPLPRPASSAVRVARVVCVVVFTLTAPSYRIWQSYFGKESAHCISDFTRLYAFTCNK